MCMEIDDEENVDEFPTTMKIGSKDFLANKRDAYQHLKENKNHTVLITSHNKAKYVMLNAEAYLELIRE